MSYYNTWHMLENWDRPSLIVKQPEISQEKFLKMPYSKIK